MRPRFSLIAPIVAAALLFVPGVSFAGQKETETVNRTVPFPDKGTLRLRSFSGKVRLTPTTGREVVIKAVRRAERDRLEHIKLEIESTGSTVSIEANKRDAGWRDRDHDNNVVDTEFDIQVPASATLDIEVFSSDIDIKGISGPQRLQTFSGTITVDATPAGASPHLDAETFSGDIHVRIAENAKAGVDFDSFSGSLDSDMPIALRSSARGRRVRGSTATGGSADVTLRFHTFSGDVRITK